MIRRIPVWLLAAALASLAVTALAAEQQSMKLRGLTFVGSRGAARDLVLEARRARFFPDTNVTYLEDIHAVVDPQDGNPGFEMECDRGELWLETNDFVATGNVRGRTADGRRFTTAWVRFDQTQGVVYTDAPVMIEEAGGTYSGGGFRYTLRDQRFKLLRGASMVREP